MPMIQVRNRRLEQFLFVHEIRHDQCSKDFDGTTVWSYTSTPYLLHVLDEWQIVQKRKKGM